MGDFKKNPKKPFEVRVPNKIRKRIAMHEKHKPDIVKTIVRPIKAILQPLKVAARKRGSMWSRFTNRVKKFLK